MYDLYRRMIYPIRKAKLGLHGYEIAEELLGKNCLDIYL